MKDDTQIIEGIKVPRKLEFGNEEHIKLRDKISNRIKLKKEGVVCPCGESKAELQRVTKDKIYWICKCDWSFTTDRDGQNPSE